MNRRGFMKGAAAIAAGLVLIEPYKYTGPSPSSSHNPEPGELFNNLIVYPNGAVTSIIDLSDVIDGTIWCEVITGKTAPSSPTILSAHPVYGDGRISKVPVYSIAPTDNRGLLLSKCSYTVSFDLRCGKWALLATNEDHRIKVTVNARLQSVFAIE